jgi:acetyl esterase
MTQSAFDYTVADFNYIEHPDGPQRLRLFMPVSNAPVPLVVDLHGGAWCNGDLKDGEPRHLALARAGIAVASVNFRHATSGYPTSLVDINYAIRWLKSHAARIGIDPARVALCGQSSGGHLAMLAAMRPGHPAYTTASLDGADATVKAVVMVWPVINPLSRYRNALKQREAGAAWVSDIPERHDTYWKTTAAMEDGNPMLILERGEPASLPPALWLQGRPGDNAHDYRDPEGSFDGTEPERFVANYRRAGGSIDLTIIDNTTKAESHIPPTVAFLTKHLA